MGWSSMQRVLVAGVVVSLTQVAAWTRPVRLGRAWPRPWSRTQETSSSTRTQLDARRARLERGEAAGPGWSSSRGGAPWAAEARSSLSASPFSRSSGDVRLWAAPSSGPRGVTLGSAVSARDGAERDGDAKVAASSEARFGQTADLAQAYKRCGEITKIFSKTFYFGTSFFAEAKKTAIWAIYVWCRRTDDIVDSPLATMLGPERMKTDLDRWEARLERIWTGEPTDALDLALADSKRRYPDLDISPYKDMIKGMLMDTPGHEIFQQRYATWEELELYCYRVAGTVGLMTLPVLGTSAKHTIDQARPPALSLGIAFQITNILRDVGEDALRGRIYLPQEDMDKFGVTEQQILDGVVNDNYVKLLQFEMARAERYYEHAYEGIAMLDPEARLAVAVALKVYKGILDKIVENGYDNFRKRAYVSKPEKFLMLPDAWLLIKDMKD